MVRIFSSAAGTHDVNGQRSFATAFCEMFKNKIINKYMRHYHEDAQEFSYTYTAMITIGNEFLKRNYHEDSQDV